MTSKTRSLTDPDGDTILISGRTSDDVYVSIAQGTALAAVHRIPAADLITAIREVTGTPEPAPADPPTAEDFARARFAEVDGEATARTYGAHSYPWRVPGGRECDDRMATLAREGRARIIREAPTDPAALIDLAWETAHVVPEGVEWIPQGAPALLRDDGGMVAYLPDGYSANMPALHERFEDYEIRTLTPLPAPRPEGAERIEAIIADQSLGFNADDIAALADRIAREVSA